MSGRWLVRCTGYPGPYAWVAIAPEHRHPAVLHSPACACWVFTTHAEAIAYADRMARGTS